jgi:hypothetical protein
MSECGLLYRRKDNLYRHLKEKHQSGAGLQNRPVDISHPDQYYTMIFLSSKHFLTYSAGKGIVVFAYTVVLH